MEIILYVVVGMFVNLLVGAGVWAWIDHDNAMFEWIGNCPFPLRMVVNHFSAMQLWPLAFVYAIARRLNRPN